MPDQRLHAVVALILCAAGTGALAWALGGGGWVLWLGCWLAAVNVVAFGYYGYDKWRAGRQGRRVPELVLHGLSVLGGSPGALAGMQWFRHKTIKGPFRVLFWSIALLQLCVAAWVVKMVWWG